MWIRCTIVGAAVLVFAAGCAPAASDVPETSICGDHVVCEEGQLLRGCGQCARASMLSFDLDACTEGMAPEAVERGLVPTVLLLQSFARLSDALAEESAFATGVDTILFNLFELPQGDLLPAGFSFDNGVYSNGLVDLTVRATFGKTYAAGEKGDLIVPSLFRGDSYLIGADTQLISNGVVEVSYNETGPLAELLGFGASPPNPFSMGAFQYDLELRSQRLASTIQTLEQRDGVSVRYEVSLERRVALDGTLIFTGDTEVPLILDKPFIGPDGGAPIASISRWSLGVVAFSSGDPELRGRVDLAVDAGELPHVTSILFGGDESGLPLVRVRCP